MECSRGIVKAICSSLMTMWRLSPSVKVLLDTVSPSRTKNGRHFPAKSLTSFTFTALQLTAKQQQANLPAGVSFSFDVPVSATASAYDKAHRLKSRVSRLSPRALTASIASSSSFLDSVSHRARNSFRRSSTSDPSNLSSVPSSPASKPSKLVSAAESPFFHLPLELRETIYGLVVARRETLHIRMKRRPNRLLHPPMHRRSRAGGDLDECVLHDCKRFLAEGGQGCYFGSFDTVSGLLRSCREMYALIPSFSYCYQAFKWKIFAYY